MKLREEIPWEEESLDPIPEPKRKRSRLAEKAGLVKCSRCGQRIKESKLNSHWAYHCKGWRIYVPGKSIVKVLDSMGNVKLVIRGLPEIDMKKVTEVMPLEIDIDEKGLIKINFGVDVNDVEEEDTTEPTESAGERESTGGKENEESSSDSERRTGFNDHPRYPIE